MTFDELNLIPPVLQAVKSRGYTQPSQIQEQAIPLMLEGKDIFGSAQTGTGKTAAFALPILQLIHNKPSKEKGVKALILAPTRELAVQIGDSFRNYGRNLRLFYTVVYGGVSQHPQAQAIRKGVDILVATPGRLLDLMNQRIIRLDKVEFLVLDEADRMLDMGFITDIKKIIHQIPAKRQTVFFSATTTPEIRKLAQSILNNPVHIDIEHKASVVDVAHKLYYVDKSDKSKLLFHIIEKDNVNNALVFTRTKRAAERLARDLKQAGINADAIHGDKSQQARQKALNNFKLNRTKILVATDVASRGIDIKFLPYVINFDVSEDSDTYTHRIGRTGRAGAKGIAISFCSGDERSYLRPILKMYPEIIVEEHPFRQAPAIDMSGSSKNVSRAGQNKMRKRFFGSKSKNRSWRR